MKGIPSQMGNPGKTAPIGKGGAVSLHSASFPLSKSNVKTAKSTNEFSGLLSKLTGEHEQDVLEWQSQAAEGEIATDAETASPLQKINLRGEGKIADVQSLAQNGEMTGKAKSLTLKGKNPVMDFSGAGSELKLQGNGKAVEINQLEKNIDTAQPGMTGKVQKKTFEMKSVSTSPGKHAADPELHWTPESVLFKGWLCGLKKSSRLAQTSLLVTV